VNQIIDDTIQRVELLYSTLTVGPVPPPNGHVPIPPESDIARHVEAQLDRLAAAIERQVPASGPSAPTTAWTPRACMWSGENHLEIVVEVPGITRADLEIGVEDRALIVRGRRPTPWGARTTQISSELPVGAFERTFVLPIRVEPQDVAARLQDGLLAIRIQRSPQADTARRITIS
jgi:HSP20 family protein